MNYIREKLLYLVVDIIVDIWIITGSKELSLVTDRPVNILETSVTGSPTPSLDPSHIPDPSPDQDRSLGRDPGHVQGHPLDPDPGPGLVHTPRKSQSPGNIVAYLSTEYTLSPSLPPFLLSHFYIPTCYYEWRNAETVKLSQNER